MSSFVSTLLDEGLRNTFEVQKYATLVVALSELDSSHAIWSSDSMELQKLLNPFVLRNCTEFILAGEGQYSVQCPETTKAWLMETLLDASYWADLEPPTNAVVASESRRNTQIRLLSGFSGFRVILSQSEAYIRGYDREQYDEECDISSLSGNLEQGLRLCSRDSELFKQLANDVQMFVPIKSPGTEVHTSHTSHSLPGVIFLSNHDDPWRIAEAIVHEHGHIQLDLLMSTDPLIENESREFYSPWRPDPRPISGLIHAIYVFTQVAEFYLGRLDDDDLDAKWVRHRLGITTGRLEVGLGQLQDCKFTNLGEKVLSDIKSRFLRLESCGFLDQTCCEALRSHHRDWCLKNKQIEYRVVRTKTLS